MFTAVFHGRVTDSFDPYLIVIHSIDEPACQGRQPIDPHHPMVEIPCAPNACCTGLGDFRLQPDIVTQ